jgi:hypothetical protein
VRVLIADTVRGHERGDPLAHVRKVLPGGAARNQEGSGLGLTLVKRILDLSGGGIEVDSAPGRGHGHHVTRAARGSIAPFPISIRNGWESCVRCSPRRFHA